MTILANTYQRGLATLLFCMILLSSATTLVFTLARTSLAEHRIMANEYRSETRHLACETGLEYARAWLLNNEPAWQIDTDGHYTLSVPLPTDLLQQNSGIRVQIRYRRQDLNSPFIQIQVQASRDNHALYNIAQFVHYQPGNQNNTLARVLVVPGTWHDLGNE